MIFAASAFYTGYLNRLERDRNAQLAVTAQSAEALAVANAGTAQANAAAADAAKATAISDRAAAVEGAVRLLRTLPAKRRCSALLLKVRAPPPRQTMQKPSARQAWRRPASSPPSPRVTRSSQPELASLLGIEAYHTAQTREARSVLLERLQNAISLIAAEVKPSIPSEQNDIRKVVYSPDGEHMAWSTFDGWVVLWNILEFKEEFRIQHQNNVNALAFSPDGKILASGSDDAAIYLTDITTRKTEKLEGVVNTVQSLKL